MIIIPTITTRQLVKLCHGLDSLLYLSNFFALLANNIMQTTGCGCCFCNYHKNYTVKKTLDTYPKKMDTYTNRLGYRNFKILTTPAKPPHTLAPRGILILSNFCLSVFL